MCVKIEIDGKIKEILDIYVILNVYEVLNIYVFIY